MSVRSHERKAAEAMEAMGVGLLPVCNGKRQVGTITDRGDKALVGIVALGDIAPEPDVAAEGRVGAAMAGISELSRPRK